jgi:hypothetical protein
LVSAFQVTLIRVWIANGINEVSLVPAFQMTLISYPGLDC